MRRILVLTVAMGLMMGLALPATAAPNNKNTMVLDVVCGGEPIQLRPNPGRGGPAWDVETGEHQVAKRFTASETVTATITEGASASFTNETVQDMGADKGNKDLVVCTTGDAFVAFEGVIDNAGFADALNADFDTDIFAVGQEVTITVEFTLTVLAVFPGK